MDLATKEQFRWKFYRLAVMLNIIILLVAIGVLAFFRAPEPYRIPAVVLLVISAGMLAIWFLRQYRTTREWLNSQD